VLPGENHYLIARMEPAPFWIHAPRDALFIKAAPLDAALIFAKLPGEPTTGLRLSISFIDWTPSTRLLAAKGRGNLPNQYRTHSVIFNTGLKTNPTRRMRNHVLIWS